MRSIFILMILSFLFVKNLYSCTESETDCSSTEVEVGVAVIESVSFSGIQDMSFGQVSRGEFVTVTTETGQTRGRHMGILNITSDYNEAGIQISCVSNSSYVSFSSGDVYFSNCLLKEQGESYSPSSSILVNQNGTSSETHTLQIGGSIQVPSDSSLQNTTSNGVVRIEINLL